MDDSVTEDSATQNLEALSEVLTRLTDNPYDISLHAKHIRLSLASGMEEQANAARQLYIDFWPANDDIWIPLIERRKSQGMDTLEDISVILDLYSTAEKDYLSIPLLQQHLSFLFERHSFLRDQEDNGISTQFNTNSIREQAESIVSQGAGHLTQSQALWEMHKDWEMLLLENAVGEQRLSMVSYVEKMHLERLKQPHADHESTFQSYSTFTTSYKPPEEYEKLLVSASKLKAQAVKGWQRRERLETSLKSSDFSFEAYEQYIQYERRGRNVDQLILTCLYERAISDASKRRFSGAPFAEEGLRSFWCGYGDILRKLNANPQHTHTIYRRAIRSVPGSGRVLADFIRFVESCSTEEDPSTLLDTVSDLYEKASSTGLLQKSLADLVTVAMARASLMKRVAQATQYATGLEELLVFLEEGLMRVRESPDGDPQYRLEQFLAESYISLAEAQDLATAVWERTAKHYKTRYLPWVNFCENLRKENKIEETRATYKSINYKILDWPEAVLNSWILFEHLYGSASDIQECVDTVQKIQIAIDLKRAKDAQKAAYETYTFTSVTNSNAVEDNLEPLSSGENKGLRSDSDANIGERGEKRKREEESNAMSSDKKPKLEDVQPPKRDRENCTVFVAGLAKGTTNEDLASLFHDCGPVREIKISQISESHVATVEFEDRESIPAALTKDKKRVHGEEVSVHLAWRSTLYVTNFPEKSDDAYIRNLFGQFGTVFDVRWPSKKFKSTRRFCYVQYTTPDAAQSALALHGREVGEGLNMNVLISDPSRKKERTDSNADAKEVYIAGLSKLAKEDDVQTVFSEFGEIKQIRIILDESGRSKGFAFVEFADDISAQKALQANNRDIKNRRIAVTIADSRVRSRRRDGVSSSKGADDSNRIIRVKNIPTGAQEAVLQQEIEKLVRVKRVELFEDIGEAIVELESVADAGKLLLLPSGIDFNGHSLSITSESKASSTTNSGPRSHLQQGSIFVPRAASLGKRKQIPISGQTAIAAQRVAPSANLHNKHLLQVDETLTARNKNQDFFRKMLG